MLVCASAHKHLTRCHFLANATLNKNNKEASWLTS